MAFKTEIKEWREKHGLTQKAAAEFFGVGMRTYQDWEYDSSKPTDSICMKCVRGLMAKRDAMGVAPAPTPPNPAPAGKRSAAARCTPAT